MSETATADHDWIAALCGRFSEATGWPLRYVPSKLDVPTPSGSGDNGPDCCWSAEIHDGQREVGFLYLDLPRDVERDRTYLSVCELAGIVAQLLNQLATASTALTSRTNEVSTLVNIGRTVPRGDDLRGALDQLLRAAVQLTGYRTAAFFLLNPQATQLQLRAVRRLGRQACPDTTRKLSDHPPDLDALVRGKAFLRRESPFAKDWLPEDSATGLCVPVRSSASPFGTLWMFDRRRRRFDARECDVLQSIAAQVAALLERTVLEQESQTQHRLKRDLQSASVVQPLDLISAPSADAGFEAAGRCTSRHELGGDLCDLVSIDAGRTAIAVGDACGNSIPAAIVMSAVRGAVRSLSHRSTNIAMATDQIVERINRALHGITNSQQFMSLVYGVLDIATRTFTYTNAGHPTPIWVHEGGIVRLESHGVLLGVVSDATYRRATIELAPGDALVFYSDGISEAMSRGKRLFRSEGIVAAIESHISGSAQDVMDVIWQNAESHRDGSHDPDDRTLLVIRVP